MDVVLGLLLGENSLEWGEGLGEGVDHIEVSRIGERISVKINSLNMEILMLWYLVNMEFPCSDDLRLNMETGLTWKFHVHEL